MSGDCGEQVCITCSDELLQVLVEEVSADGATAVGTVRGQRCEIGVELLDGVRPGDVVLVHGGVALQREGAA